MSQPSGRGPGKGPHRSRLDGIACSSAGSLRRCASFERKKSLACRPDPPLEGRKIIFQTSDNVLLKLPKGADSPATQNIRPRTSPPPATVRQPAPDAAHGRSRPPSDTRGRRAMQRDVVDRATVGAGAGPSRSAPECDVHCSSPDASSVAADGAAETVPGPSPMGAPPMGAAPPRLQGAQAVARCLQAYQLCRRRGRASGAEPWPAKAKLGTSAMGECLPARGSSLAPNLCAVGAHAPPRSKVRVQGLRTYSSRRRVGGARTNGGPVRAAFGSSFTFEYMRFF